MKKLILLIFLLPLLSFIPHKFYVTNNIVEFNPRTKIYEVTCKIFTDDLELAVSPNGKSLHLGEQNESIDADHLIENYIVKHFKIQLNDTPIQLKYIGKEIAPDLSHIYFEFTFVDTPTTVKVENTCFFDLFEGQKNIIDLRLNGWYYTMFLTKDSAVESKVR